MKVWPKNDQVRKYIKHPTARGFRPEGPAEWPADVFTFRLLQDGDITTADPAGKQKPPATSSAPPTSSAAEPQGSAHATPTEPQAPPPPRGGGRGHA